MAPRHPTSGTINESPPGFQEPVGVPEPVTMLRAWQLFTYELSTGIPTQMHYTREVYASFLPTLRVRRLGHHPTGPAGPRG